MVRLAFATERISWKAWNILPYLAERFEITLITYSKPEEIPEAKYREVVHVCPRRHEMLPSTAWEMSRHIDRLYKEGRIDFAYVYSSIAYFIRLCPYVNVVNGSFFEDFQIWMSYAPYKRKLRALVGFIHYVIPEVIACKRAAKIITVSQSLGNLIRHRYGRDVRDVYPVLNGLGIDYLDLYDEDKFDSPTISILYSGRLHLRKGILNLVKEFTRRPHISVSFNILGDGPDRNELQRIAQPDKRIVIRGHLDRASMAKLIQETVIYVFPSLHEGFGLSLVEAMASGHACLVYDMPVNREILGEAGIYAPYNRPAAMLDILEDSLPKREGLRLKAREAHEKAKQYSWERCAHDMEDALNRIHKEITAGY